MQQKPRALTKVEEGTEIDLVVSKGKDVKTLAVPKLVGQTLEDARVSLVGFRIGQISYQEDKMQDEGVVLNQSLKWGQDASEGSKIDLVVNQYKSQNDTTISKPSKSGKKQLSIALPEGEETVNVSIKEIGKDSQGVIYNKQVNVKEAGGNLTVPIEGSGKKDYEIYINQDFYGKVSVEF